MTQRVTQPKRIPITAAKRIAQEFLQDQVILITFDKTSGTTHVVTYGKSKEDCDQAAIGGNKLKREFLGWPEELCNAVPRRMR